MGPEAAAPRKALPRHAATAALRALAAAVTAAAAAAAAAAATWCFTADLPPPRPAPAFGWATPPQLLTCPAGCPTGCLTHQRLRTRPPPEPPPSFWLEVTPPALGKLAEAHGVSAARDICLNSLGWRADYFEAMMERHRAATASGYLSSTD